jgi:hypothetical protein
MRPLLWLSFVSCLSLWLSTLSPALEVPALPARPTAEEFARKVAESRKEALRLYPDLGNPDSIFSRAAKVGEDNLRRVDPYYFEDRWDYPLRIAGSTSEQLRAFSPHDPVFSEVVPSFTTKQGIVYSQLRVTKLHRDGISVAHEGGTAFIHRDDLTDPQRDKYRTRWSTEVIVPERLIFLVNSAMLERDQDLKLFDSIRALQHDQMLAKAKSDLDREACENHELGDVPGIRNYIDKFTLRLFELAYAAQESGQREAMERIEEELREPVPEPYKTRLKELDGKIRERDVRYEEIILLLRGKRCELRWDGRPVQEGIPKRGKLGSSSFEIVSPEHIRITSSKNGVPSHWVFKVDPKKGEAALLPEASKYEEEGEVTFCIVN